MSREALKYADNEDMFEYRAETFLRTCGEVLKMYMPTADDTIEMLVGRDSKATIKFAGPITQEAIMDVMAHLSFYKKYFPKTDRDPGARTLETILAAYKAALAEDRSERESKLQITHSPSE